MSASQSPAAGVTSPIVPRPYLYAFILVTSLFALWGFANDITNPMVKAFKDIFLLDNTQSSLVQFAFYGGYATMALPAALIIRKYSFKTGIVVGLALYAVGALLFIPASMAKEFNLFLVAYCILTFGLAFLETSANPYILSLGPIETATRRLNLAQSFNPMGSLIGMWVASQLILPALDVNEFRAKQAELHPEYKTMAPAQVDKAITGALVEFHESEPEAYSQLQDNDLATIRVPYIVLGLVVLGVMALFMVSRLPATGHPEEDIHPLQVLKNLMHFRYVGGVVAQAANIGAQILCWTFIIHYGMTLLRLSASEAQNYNIAAMVIFVTGRFICTYFLRYVSPGLLLGTLALGGMALSLGTVFLQGFPGLYCLVGISGCMSLMFPTIYGIALDGLSIDDAKLGSAGLIFAIVGGALMPPLQGRIIDMGDFQFAGRTLESVRVSFLLPLLCFAVVAAYGFLTARKAKLA